MAVGMCSFGENSELLTVTHWHWAHCLQWHTDSGLTVCSDTLTVAALSAVTYWHWAHWLQCLHRHFLCSLDQCIHWHRLRLLHWRTLEQIRILSLTKSYFLRNSKAFRFRFKNRNFLGFRRVPFFSMYSGCTTSLRVNKAKNLCNRNDTNSFTKST